MAAPVVSLTLMTRLRCLPHLLSYKEQYCLYLHRTKN